MKKSFVGLGAAPLQEFTQIIDDELARTAPAVKTSPVRATRR